MTYPDFHARAELYLGSDRHTAIAQGARRFGSAAQAIRFAFEEAAPVSLHGAMLRVGDATFAGDDLAALYRSAAFPLPRRHDIKRARARRAADRQSWAPGLTRMKAGPQHAARA
jgi:hypothetical protein